MALTLSSALSDLGPLIDFLSTLEAAIAASKGASPVSRDFDIAIAVLPKLKALAVLIESQAAPAVTP